MYRKRMWMGVLMVVLSWAVLTDQARPKLQDEKITYSQIAGFDSRWDIAQIELEFDQDLYLLSTALCVKQEEPCKDGLACTACDWTAQALSADICAQANCCGPQTQEERDMWCGDPRPYASLILGEAAPVMHLAQGEFTYFRFYVGPEDRCKALQVAVSSVYGSVNFFISNRHPYPDRDNAIWTRDTEFYTFGQASLTICPALEDAYLPATYAIGVQAHSGPAGFQLYVSADSPSQPLPLPDETVSCDLVPPDLIAQFSDETQTCRCLEDGQTWEITYPEEAAGIYQQLVLPIPAGCHTISLAGMADPSDYLSLGTDLDLFCVPLNDSLPVTWTNAATIRWHVGSDQLVFASCFDEPAFLRCAAQILVPGRSFFIWSTQAFVYKYPIQNIFPSDLTLQQGIGAASLLQLGRESVDGSYYGAPCIDFSACGHWLTSSSVDPLSFWPPPPAAQISITFGQDPAASFLYPASSRARVLTISLVVQSEEHSEYPSLSTIQNASSIVIMSITNAVGEPPLLPNDGPVDAPMQTSFLQRHFPNIAVKSLLDIPIAQFCEYEALVLQTELISNRIAPIVSSADDAYSLEQLRAEQFFVDLLVESRATQSCLSFSTNMLGQTIQNITLSGITDCNIDSSIDPAGFANDPCCSSTSFPVSCCIPRTEQLAIPQYVASLDSTLGVCGSPHCALSMLEDLAFSLNSVDTDCYSATAPLHFLTEDGIDKLIRQCQFKAGLGFAFDGIPCVRDADCAQVMGRCDALRNRCALPDRDVIEVEYLECFISRMNGKLEDYLRRNVLPPEIAAYDRSTPEFFNSLRSASSSPDCINVDDPLDISTRTRYVYDATNPRASCKASALGLNWPSDAALAEALCPPIECLGTTCRTDPQHCYHQCWPAWTYNEANIDTCAQNQQICSIDDATLCSSSTTSGNTHVCAYCPPNSDGPCIIHPMLRLQTREQCLASVACELPDGSIEFGLSEAECLTYRTKCSVDCPGQSCRSGRGLEGICTATSVVSETACYSLVHGPIWTSHNICVLSNVLTSTECESINDAALKSAWTTCEAQSQCDAGSPETQYLQCLVYNRGPCTSKEECERSGMCSDREYTTLVRASTDGTGYDKYSLQVGACISSGIFFGWNLPGDSECDTFDDRIKIGCRDPKITRASDCPSQKFGSGIFVDSVAWQEWVTPALTAGECVSVQIPRYGCMLAISPEDRLVWLNETYCDACSGGGVAQYAFDWKDGVWVSSTPRSLAWIPVEQTSKYQWVDQAISFPLIQQWVTAQITESYTFSIKSAITCRTNSLIGLPLLSLTCDCTTSQSDACYPSLGNSLGGINQIATLVAVDKSCILDATVLYASAARAVFSESSMKAGCTRLALKVIDQSWFAAPPETQRVSFGFVDRRAKKSTAVVNAQGVGVGYLLGDGIIVEASLPDMVVEFQLCFSIDAEASGSSLLFDFGTSLDLQLIHPLLLAGITVANVDDEHAEICAILNFTQFNQSSMLLFPILRAADFESLTVESVYAETSIILMYTLGACYCVVFVLCLLAIILYLALFFLGKKMGKLPTTFYVSGMFLCFCVFRICYLYMLPSGVFDDIPLSEFIVVELPTFFLFSAVLLILATWYSISTMTISDKEPWWVWPCWLLCNIVVWSLWVAITIVYSQLIKDFSDESDVCPGRIPPDQSQLDSSIRTLSIIYYSIVISWTFLIAVLFFYVLVRLWTRLVDANSFAARAGLISRLLRMSFTIIIGFLVRSILFIIMLALDFSSAIYMFITLFITEVLVMLLVLFSFNIASFIASEISSFSSHIGGSNRSGHLSDTSRRSLPTASSLAG